MTDTKPRGIFLNEPRDKAPDFVDGDINIKVEDFTKFLQEQGTVYVKLDILRSREGGRYLKLNTFKPKEEPVAKNATTEDETHYDADGDSVPF